MAPLPIAGVGGVTPIQPLNPVGADGLATPGAAPAAPASFQGLLADKLGSVMDLQNQADLAAQAVATGQSSDLAGATVAVEKASIATELVGAIRNKAIDAYQDVMRMQV
jgi:flagellar hook-basal body complex protein FliE